MNLVEIKDFGFSYPESSRKVLEHVNLNIKEGTLNVIMGRSGCGKSTLLRQLKSVLAPAGEKEGEILYRNIPLRDTDHRTQSQEIGFVMQNPDNQIVTDKVWHELAFGLESLGYDNATIRLILDEPTSQLDPIAASDFLETVKKINRDIGTTVLLTEHRLQDIIPYADRVFVMDEGTLFLEGKPREIGTKLKEQHHGMFLSMPVPMQIYAGTDSALTCPLTVSEGRQWIREYIEEKGIKKEKIQQANQRLEKQGEKNENDTAGFFGHLKRQKENTPPAIQMKDVWFRYEKDSPDVIQDLSLEVKKGEFYALVGGNGTGKSTTLSLLGRVHQPYSGRIYLDGKDLRSFSDRKLYCGYLGVMPQNPQSIFLKKTVLEDLYSVIGGKKEKPSNEYPISMKKEKAIEGIVSLTHLEGLLERHPYDLSGGEQQRLALAKVLLLRPKILLMDEPTKGMDAEYKEELGSILKKLQSHGMTIFMISHDVEFVAEYADTTGLFFEGNIVTSKKTRDFFAGNNFYTTAANRMARGLFPEAVTGKDVVSCLTNPS